MESLQWEKVQKDTGVAKGRSEQHFSTHHASRKIARKGFRRYKIKHVTCLKTANPTTANQTQCKHIFPGLPAPRACDDAIKSEFQGRLPQCLKCLVAPSHQDLMSFCLWRQWAGSQRLWVDWVGLPRHAADWSRESGRRLVRVRSAPKTR